MSCSTLVLGGARSGKSRHAEGLAVGHDGQRVYIATAQALDDEMASRIAMHREQRGHGWRTVEALLDLPGVIAAEDGEGRFILVDCVTLWLSNLILAEREPRPETERLARLIPTLRSRIVLVSNEVGMGIVPDNALARRFRDEAGWANQRLAEMADEVILVAAGLPLRLKPPRRE